MLFSFFPHNESLYIKPILIPSGNLSKAQKINQPSFHGTGVENYIKLTMSYDYTLNILYKMSPHLGSYKSMTF